ncbi:uncharacterized protein LOC105700307 [Orussus abietinus]|uniref:uncharacterized protein LOC105700307 n=1 Tax=Orussus abietinus TaxID=222816 RepID=UPI0006266AB1|nr:uncharacterized protein LOC105700307 [Orussus abietinus]XP_012281446.1 uncharacterized protein LOC105700307 [Orussus abietinus]XP_012281447.1 uncharacterized protein LOC105700307 [Orussus abietinus]
MANGVPVLLITANVGSIFEEPSVMLKIWTEEFLSTISRLDPKFIALHCQEVGGKNYEQSMKHVEYFVRLLMSSEELRLFDRVRVFLDEDYSSAEHFTALGNFYFVHVSLKDVLLWDFKECTFVPVSGKEVHSGNIEAVTTKEKAKFPQDFFPECKWSRKGFLRTRWNIGGTVFDLINIHLFHDASNFIAMETFPSVYSKTRRRALEHTLDRFHNDQYPNVPYFLFGDFNFRTDTAGVIKKLTEDTHESRLSSKGNISRLQFRNKEEDLILTLGKKEFSHCQHQNVFIKNGGQWLREYDKELEDFDGRLFEFPINFVPSYPFEEDIKEGTSYMQTRVPAWCDRILLSPTAKSLVQNMSSPNAVEYGIIGPLTCMGDHKPVYLRAMLASDAGTIECCSLSNAPEFCFRVPDHYVELLSMLPDCRSYAGTRTFPVDSSHLLHAVPVKHDPYTPDSMDSPSPNAIAASGEIGDLDYGVANSVAADLVAMETGRTPRAVKRVDRAVSPALLKSRLELIARTKENNPDSEPETSDMKRSPSECHLRSSAEDQQWTVRKNRSNSDVSWQRSHLLTQAWIQGRGRQGYYSFGNFTHHSSSGSSPAEGAEGLPPDLVIPRIAIINASNFESNESSVHLHGEDRLAACADHRLSASYSDDRTKTSAGSSNPERSDDTGRKTDDDERLSFGVVELPCDDGKDVTRRNQYMDLEVVRVKALEGGVLVESIIESVQGELNDRWPEDRSNYCRKIMNQTVSKDVEARCRVAYESPEGLLGGEVEDGERTKPPGLERDNNVISPDTYKSNVARRDARVERSDSRQEVTSKHTTRSNSLQSQDTKDAFGNVKSMSKACKVSEKYGHDFAEKKRRCRKCCCVIC